MCGFIGLVNHNNALSKEEFENCLQLIKHRGPDSKSVIEIGDSFGILGFVRLSIIDVEGGTQPIYNEDKSVAVILNGEIYNYVELTAELKRKKHVFSTSSDTEVLVHLYEEYGIDMITRLRGMFAFAIWDENKNEFYLVRDRLGIKPLYYTKNNYTLGFGSEIKPLLRFPFVKKDLDNRSVSTFLEYGYVMAPSTIYIDIKKLEPGHYLKVTKDAMKDVEYWNCLNPIKQNTKLDLIEKEIVKLFSNSIKLHMRSDVPVGVFLSGGIDSGMIAAFASQEVGKLSTYTMRFDDAEFDESDMAEKVAQMYNTDHHCYTVSNQQMLELFPKLMWIFDEPLGDSGILPNYLITELVARDGIKVILSGAGGDELFAGYSYYFRNSFEEKLERISPLVKLVAASIKKLMPENSRKLIRSISYNSDRFVHYNERKIVWGNGELKKLLLFPDCNSNQNKKYYDAFGGESLNKVLFTDIKTYLSDDLLYLADRACMIHSVEGRVPFLDHKLVEYMLGVSVDDKTLGGNRKGILKQIARKYLPSELIDLPKQGFNAPVSSWSKGKFGKAMIEVLKSERCQSRGILNIKELNKYLNSKEVLGKDFHKTYLLFTLEMYIRIHVENDYNTIDSVNWKEAYE